MHDTLRSEGHSFEIEKKDNDVTHLEKLNTHTPPGELERGHQLAPTISRGPVVHDKVHPLSTTYATHTDHDR
jgi:hypothetical protein